MANNHYGNIDFGLEIIQQFSQVTSKYTNYFDFAFKFQFRDLDTFIHKDYKNRLDLKYVKRFTETKLYIAEFIALKKEAKKYNYKTVCTAFDEPSVDLIIQMEFDFIKIASCSFTDWPLLNKIANDTNLPIIASTAGSSLDEIDKVVSFFTHRNKNLSLMHCVGEYPTLPSNMQLNQIDLLKKRYPNLKIGLSSHEMQGEYLPIQISIAKGTDIFEKHVVIPSNKYSLNHYSTTPEYFGIWLQDALVALQVCGEIDNRYISSLKEQEDLRQFKRGVFAKQDFKTGDIIDRSNIYYAWPNIDNQILANDMSKYVHFTAQKDISKDAPILTTVTKKLELREKVWDAVQRVKKFLLDSGVVFPGKAQLELSHHFGIDKFYETGITMITVINKEYCKKLIVVLPGQCNPTHFHRRKTETFFILYGSLKLQKISSGGMIYPYQMQKGDIQNIMPTEAHDFSSEQGCIIEELSTQHFPDDSTYFDNNINNNKNRKTIVNYWL